MGIQKLNLTIYGLCLSYVAARYVNSVFATKFISYALFAVLACYINAILSKKSYSNFLQSQKHRWNWPDEIAVITGGSSGLGKLYALGLLKLGSRVVILDISPCPEDLLDNDRVNYFKCDVSLAEEIKQVCQRVKKEVGDVSILINNAGIAQEQLIIDKTPEALSKIFNVNLLSHWFTVQEFLPAMLKNKKGHIVTIASVASFFAAPSMVDYAVTKAGMMAFHEGLRSEIRAAHKCPEILLTIVHPLWALTGMTAPHQKRLEKAGVQLMDPQIIADAVVNQITACEGGEIVLGKGGRLVQTNRFWPAWMSWLLRKAMERKTSRYTVDKSVRE